MHARTLLRRANAHRLQGQYDLAIADYNAAFSLCPDSASKADCRFNRGIVHDDQGQYDLAIADYNEAFNLYSDNLYKGNCRFNSAIVHYDHGQYDLAIAASNEALDLFPDNLDKAHCHFRRGMAYQAQGQGRYNLAIDDFNKAFNLYPDNLHKGKCCFQLGIAHQAQGQYDLAIDDYNEAYKLLADNLNRAHCRWNRGLTYNAQGQYDLAIADYNEAFNLYSDNHKKADCILKRGLVRQAQGEHASAVADFAIAIGLNPQIASRFSIENLKGFFKNYPAFYDKSLRANLTFCQRQSFCNEGEAPNLSEAYEYLEDPVTNRLMNDPVTIPVSGQTYDRKTIEDVFVQLGSPVQAPCPLSRLPIVQAEFKKLATNILIKKQIEKYLLLLEEKARNVLLAASTVNAPNSGAEGQPNVASVRASSASVAASSNSNRLKEGRLDHSRQARYEKLAANVKRAKAQAQKEAFASKLQEKITPRNLG